VPSPFESLPPSPTAITLKSYSKFLKGQIWGFGFLNFFTRNHVGKPITIPRKASVPSVSPVVNRAGDGLGEFSVNAPLTSGEGVGEVTGVDVSVGVEVGVIVAITLIVAFGVETIRGLEVAGAR
jgi:hypothetical protein